MLTEGTLSSETLTAVKTVMEEQPSVKHPLALAQTLFAGGYVEEAAAFYQKAYDAMDPNDPVSAPERAWILFQIGNCLRQTQPEQALQAYHQLTARYPDSVWVTMAKPWQELAQWYAAEQPRHLLQEAKVQRFYGDMLDQAQNTLTNDVHNEEQSQ
jgi:tetratricopeptide (TPR) repeat protein